MENIEGENIEEKNVEEANQSLSGFFVQSIWCWNNYN